MLGGSSCNATMNSNVSATVKFATIRLAGFHKTSKFAITRLTIWCKRQDESQ
jgi:hypothetical protein